MGNSAINDGHDANAITLSPQQTAILEYLRTATGNGVVLARAGCGKTFTIKQMVRFIYENNMGDCYIGAFNRAIADEVGADIAAMEIPWNVCSVNTAHGFGLGAIRRMWPKINVDDKKIAKIIKEIVRTTNDEHERTLLQICETQVAKLVSFAKQRGVGFTGAALENARRDETWWRIVEHYGLDDTPDDITPLDIIAAARKVLQMSAALDHQIVDFDDMVLVPVTRNLRIWPRKFVFIDEAQDTNPARRALFSKMLARNGRLFAVGDDRQAINGFAGADADALDMIISKFGATTLPLTVTYRCPKAVVACAQSIVTDIIAHETAPEGIISHIKFSTEDDAPLWFTDKNGPRIGDVVLCRTTAPLIDTAYAMIRKGIGCFVEGRDIGTGLIALTRRWSRTKTIGGLVKHLENYAETETQKWLAKDRADKAATVADRVETLMTICDWCRDHGMTSVDALRKEIELMFSGSSDGNGSSRKTKIDPTKTVTLSTIHKSKGREWDRVFFLHSAKCPSQWARREWEVGQEMNLIYVATTRAKNELIYVNEV